MPEETSCLPNLKIWDEVKIEEKLCSKVKSWCCGHPHSTTVKRRLALLEGTADAGSSPGCNCDALLGAKMPSLSGPTAICIWFSMSALTLGQVANTNWWLLWVSRVKNPFVCTKTWIDKVTTVALFTVNIKHFHRRKPGSYQHISKSNCVPIQVKDGWVYFHFTSESWLSYICIILSVSLRPGKHWIFWWHD